MVSKERAETSKLIILSIPMVMQLQIKWYHMVPHEIH